MAYTQQGKRQCAVEARHAVFRDVRQPRHLSRRLVCLYDASSRTVAARNGETAGRE